MFAHLATWLHRLPLDATLASHLMCCGLLWFEPKGTLQYDAVQVYKAPWREWVETQTAGRKKIE